MTNFFKKSQTLVTWLTKREWFIRDTERILGQYEEDMEALRIKTASKLTYQLRNLLDHAEGAEVNRIKKEIDRLQESLPLGKQTPPTIYL